MTSIPKPDTWRPMTTPPTRPNVGFGPDPVGALEIADRLGLVDRTVHMIRRRGQLPAPDYESVNGSRAWEWSTILWWAGETGRLKGEDWIRERSCSRRVDLRHQYESMFGHNPPDLTGQRRAPGVETREDEHEGVPAVPSMP